MPQKLILPNTYKIAIAGSHSCGKTSLVRALANRIEIPIIHEIAATFLPESRIHIDTQYKIMRKQIDTEKEYKSFLSDRSVIDNLAYSSLIYQTNPTEFKCTYTHCVELAYKHIAFGPYNLLIVVDELLPLRPSAHRNFMQKHEQEFILNFIRNELNGDSNMYIGIPYIRVKGNIGERIKTVMGFLKTGSEDTFL
jgi:nicotinamide riboside kinase